MAGGFRLAWLAIALAWSVAASAEPFEMIVMRGGDVSRVTGDASGEIREELLREAPRSPDPEPKPAPARARRDDDDEDPSVVVIVVPRETVTYPAYVGGRPIVHRGPRHQGPKPGVIRRLGPSGRGMAHRH